MGDSNKTQAKVQDDDRICAICIESMSVDDKLIQMPNCSHQFHTKCVLGLLKHRIQDNSNISDEVLCPICRVEVVKLPSRALPTSTQAPQPVVIAINHDESSSRDIYREREQRLLSNWFIGTAATLSFVWFFYLATNTPDT